MLEIGFFKNPRFSAGVLSVSIMALALIGINYSLTLYMQFVNGYTPLQAACASRLLPLASCSAPVRPGALLAAWARSA
jgi:hypothetical protein